MSGPQLAIVVDTEEEFDWEKPFSRSATGTNSIAAQLLAHNVYTPLGIVPTYVIDYPVASNSDAIAILGGLQRAGQAEIGAHLHPWVCPPHEEVVTTHNSYQCNLPPELERAKMIVLTEAIMQNFGRPPRVYKAGRYGYGPNTRAVLLELGYEVECSYVPHVSFASDGGPRYYGTPDQPFWLDDEHRLLEVPLTSGFIGAAADFGAQVAPLFDNGIAAKLHIPGVLARTGILARSRLTPEGVSTTEQCRLLKSMVMRGRTMFTLTYHSPSLAVGNTPYVRNDTELKGFIASLHDVLHYFRDVLGGSFTTVSAMRDQLRSVKPTD